MKLTSYGAVREVTGSMHLLACGSDRILLDCGMFQGRRKEADRKNRDLPFDPGTITNMVLSHAHIDHSGRIPFLVKNGFHGRIICTRATMDACRFLLLDSAHIQESDAQYLNYKTIRAFLYNLKSGPEAKSLTNRELAEIKKLLKQNGSRLNGAVINDLLEQHRLDEIKPLYTVAEAEQSLSSFDGYPYEHPVTIGRDMTVTFYDAGHILGSAFCMIQARENGRTFHVAYTGDMGRFGKPIIEDPTLKFPPEQREIDLLIMESTYGDRFHEPVRDIRPRLRKVIQDTTERGGSLIIPSFAFGRTQEILYVLHELYDEGGVPRLPVYVDSPLATKLTQVFAEHPELYDRETHEAFLKKGKNPFNFPELTFIESVEDSMAVMRENRPHIIIASSGMMEAGRILHHLRYKIHNPRNTILLVGFMAANTLGRRIQELGRAYEESGRKGPAPEVKFLNKVYPLQAHVVELGGFSAHADRNEMLRFLKQSVLKIKRIAVVHGEEEQSVAFAEFLKSEGFDAMVPRAGEPIGIGL